MIIIPAIDLLSGEAVRLYKGDYGKKTVYSPNPHELALKFEEMGARYLHVVDLDGAKTGDTINLETIRKIRQAIKIPMQLGGGVRTAETVKMYLEDVGIDRVILGTVAVTNPEFVDEMIAKYGAERIVVGVDAKDEMVATAGWLESGGIHYIEYITRLKAQGVKYIVATDIGRDGTLTSPNWDMYKEIAKIDGMNVVVSGGVANDQHIHDGEDYYGVIVGKAFYDGKVDLEACLNRHARFVIEPRVIDGLLPAIVQDFYTGRVLMLAYVNQVSYDFMRANGTTCFWSRSRNELWNKGATSGDFQEIKHIAFDCDEDTLLIQVKQLGVGACHTGSYSCFGQEAGLFDVLNNLYVEIEKRGANLGDVTEKSYTNYLLTKGVDKICKKIGEESAETIIAAKNADKQELVGESSDLIYHLLVLLFNQGVRPKDIYGELGLRRKVEGNKKASLK